MTKGLGNRLVPVLLAAFVLLGVAGCHHPAERYPEAHPEAWTPTDVETMLGGDDPCEPWNRSMFACTDFLMDYVADPVGRVYTSIFPPTLCRTLQQCLCESGIPRAFVQFAFAGRVGRRRG